MDKPRVVKREKLYKVGDLVDNVLENMNVSVEKNNNEESIEEIKIAWKHVLGKSITKYTKVHSFKNGVLVVMVTKSVWRSELEYMKASIIKKINNNIGRDELRNIILR